MLLRMTNVFNSSDLLGEWKLQSLWSLYYEFRTMYVKCSHINKPLYSVIGCVTYTTTAFYIIKIHIKDKLATVVLVGAIPKQCT